MDSSHLTPKQLSDLIATLERYVAFHEALLARMVEQGFPSRDPLYAAALRARDGLLVMLDEARALHARTGEAAQ